MCVHATDENDHKIQMFFFAILSNLRQYFEVTHNMIS